MILDEATVECLINWQREERGVNLYVKNVAAGGFVLYEKGENLLNTNLGRGQLIESIFYEPSINNCSLKLENNNYKILL